MRNSDFSQNLSFEPTDNRRLADLCGQFNEHLQQLEKHLEVSINNRGNVFQIAGNSIAVRKTAKILEILYSETKEEDALTPELVHAILQEARTSNLETIPEKKKSHVFIRTKNLLIKPRGETQKNYVEKIEQFDINFGVGPAGTGKTYLAVACAVAALERGDVERIIIARPAVEAGERLGFLPGDLSQKVDPYLRPIYDALYEMLGTETVGKLVEKNIIEVAPLAFMRGRTLARAFVILDESQNTTPEQMKMFLTRLGIGSKAVVTGDITQVDLPRGHTSGLHHVIKILEDVKEISFTHFKNHDIVRNNLVQKVVEAYDRHSNSHGTS